MINLHNSQEQRQIQCYFFVELTFNYKCSISTTPPVHREISSWVGSGPGGHSWRPILTQIGQVLPLYSLEPFEGLSCWLVTPSEGSTLWDGLVPNHIQASSCCCEWGAFFPIRFEAVHSSTHSEKYSQCLLPSFSSTDLNLESWSKHTCLTQRPGAHFCSVS